MPVWWTVINATKSSHDFFFHSFYALPREFDLFSNISAAWNSAGLGTGFINSLLYGIVGAAASILIASLASYAIVVLRIRGGFTIFLAIFSATVFPLQMYIIPLFRMFNSLDLYDTRLGMFLFYTAVSVPFCTLVLRGFYSTVPRDYREAALVEGAAEIRVLQLIYMPLARSAMLVLFLFQFTWIWNDLLLRDRPHLVTVGPPRDGQPEQPDGGLRRHELPRRAGRDAGRRIADAAPFLRSASSLHPGLDVVGLSERLRRSAWNARRKYDSRASQQHVPRQSQR